MSIAALLLRIDAKTRALEARRADDSADGAVAAMAAVAARFDSAWAGLREAEERRGSLACKPGCAACCHQHVGVLPIEAVAIARRLSQDSPRARDLKSRVEAFAARIAGTTAAQRRGAGIACAFLEPHGGCAIYADRPLRCRGLHSRDVARCEAMAAGINRPAPDTVSAAPPFPLQPLQLADAALAGLAEATTPGAMAPATLELGQAIALLLADPARAAAVMSGQDDLREAQLEKAPPTVAER